MVFSISEKSVIESFFRNSVGTPRAVAQVITPSDNRRPTTAQAGELLAVY